jgi:hypothetical protein
MAKVKTSPKPIAKPTKGVNENLVLEKHSKTAKERFLSASKIYDVQDSLTKEVIDRIRDRLSIVYVGAININNKPVKLLDETVSNRILFLAVEIMSDLYLNGIRVANFKPDDEHCISCKREI